MQYDNDSNRDVDDPSEQDDVSTVDIGRKKIAFQYSKEVYDMKCEWAECDFESCVVDSFVRHVTSHYPQGEQRVFYCCLWDSCGFDSDDLNVVVRHINYHSYHTKIKAIGSSMMKQSNLPLCTLDYAGRNLLPVLPLESNCEWFECNYETNNFQSFLNHVQCHVQTLPMRGCIKPKTFTCEWRSCSKVFKDPHKLREHVRTHTQEKLVGCPVCGTQFSNKTKFYDHCKRQEAATKKGFKCSHCRKNFATERILREHIRLHINLFKCPMCDMTCPFQSTLALHVRYRHMDLKPFQCNFCDHRSKTQRDLENHQLTHCSENFWVCEQDDCDYSCRSKDVLKEHYVKTHTEDQNLCLYYCHICPNKYRRGANLTVHLKKEHSYRWASGHSRFKYVRGDDGIYRLQTVRYESIEVTKEMMKAKTSGVKTEMPRKKYLCTFESPISMVVKEDNESERRMARALVNGKLKIDTTVEEESNDSSHFEESLRKYLGVTDTAHFIKVIKADKAVK
ncbi:hypothetical protein RUM43_000060 [Polyplax serrata]|uniref:C2H2-type domain-containing protein n=1 Tax=Polyplax serrata TaxID=468196 RepID=A0AAN8XRJ1_POLSC